MKMIKLLCSLGALLLVGAWLNSANATIIQFDLQGTGDSDFCLETKTRPRPVAAAEKSAPAFSSTM